MSIPLENILEINEYPRRLLHTVTFLCGEGSWALLPHEKTVIEPLQNYFDSDTWLTISNQLLQPHFVERIPDGKINILRYYQPKKLSRLGDNRFNDLLIKLNISIGGETSLANVTFYEGVLFSIEFKLASKTFRNRVMTVNEVNAGLPNQSLTTEIDREEHGAENV